MALLRGLLERAAVLTIGSFYGCVVFVKLLFDTFKIGPSAMFTQKKRSVPPKCLEDPSLGIHAYAHLENIRMHYVTNGAEDKPLMLLVHGFPEFWFSWRHQLKEFKDDYRVVAVDLRGYGDSDKPSGISNYAVPALVNDLKQLVTALGYKQCVLVGHDWGGALSWAFAEMYPDMISRLIILNCPNNYAFNRHLKKSFRQFKLSWYMFFFQLPWFPEFAMRTNDFAVLNGITKTKLAKEETDYTAEEEAEAYKYNFTRNSLTSPLNFYRSIFTLEKLSSDRSRMPGMGNKPFTMPVLIIWGEKDLALDKPLAEISAEVCKGKTIVRYIEDASHFVQMSRPDLVNRYIREFLAEN